MPDQKYTPDRIKTDHKNHYKTRIKTPVNDTIAAHEKAPATTGIVREHGPLVRSGHGSAYQKTMLD